jgi:hypothetical protein
MTKTKSRIALTEHALRHLVKDGEVVNYGNNKEFFVKTTG